MGGPLATGCGCQSRKCDISATSACFQAELSLRFAGGKEVSHETKPWPIEGVVDKG